MAKRKSAAQKKKDEAAKTKTEVKEYEFTFRITGKDDNGKKVVGDVIRWGKGVNEVEALNNAIEETKKEFPLSNVEPVPIMEQTPRPIDTTPVLPFYEFTFTYKVKEKDGEKTVKRSAKSQSEAGAFEQVREKIIKEFPNHEIFYTQEFKKERVD